MGVPDPAVHSTMNKLREAGLKHVIDGRPEQSAPKYPTAKAFEIYVDLGGQLPPSAAQYLKMIDEHRQTSAHQESEARAKAEGARIELVEQQRQRRLTERLEHRSRVHQEAIVTIEAFALDRGLATYRMIARRYGRITRDDRAEISFQSKLKKNGLVHVDRVSSILLFSQKDADVAATKAGFKTPNQPWSSSVSTAT